MAITYEPLGTYTVSNENTKIISFTSFSGYTDLVAVVTGGFYNATQPSFFLNGDSDWGSYSSTWMDGAGGSVRNGRYQGQGYGLISPNSWNDTGQNFGIINFSDYASSNTYKSIISNATTDSGPYPNYSVTTYRSNSPITSIDFRGVGYNNWIPGSKFTIYGIGAA